MREFKVICIKLELEISYVIDNIVSILADYKLKTLTVEDNDTNKFIKECLLNNTDPLMRENINSLTYAGNIQINNNKVRAVQNYSGIVFLAFFFFYNIYLGLKTGGLSFFFFLDVWIFFWTHLKI